MGLANELDLSGDDILVLQVIKTFFGEVEASSLSSFKSWYDSWKKTFSSTGWESLIQKVIKKEPIVNLLPKINWKGELVSQTH